MNEAALIATEIQDLASSVGDVASAITKRPAAQVTVNVPEQAAPQVNVQVPQQAAPTVDVTVPAPVVNVSPSPVSVTPQINVEAAEPQAYEVTITERDREGLIRRFVIQPVTVITA